MYDSIEDEELDALLPSSHNESPKPKAASKTGVVINRVLVLFVLAGLVVVSVWLQSFQTQLIQQLSTDEDKIKELEDTVQAQGIIIARFNESVTNKDVMGQLHTMQNRWDHERTELFDQLTQTKADVRLELNSTMIQLDETVKEAKAEIHEQVDSVKTNFDQYVVQTEHRFNIENDFMRYQIAGTITVLSCLISMWHMGTHTRKMSQPAIQRKILAILWMCPIYAVTSCLSLIFPKYGGYLGIIKDFYEAYIIYQFLSFCIAAIGGGDREKVIDMLTKQVHHLTPPFRFFFCCGTVDYDNDDRALASAILLQCQLFAMQFVFWKPFTSIAQFALKKFDYYGPYADDATDWKSIQFWVVIVENVSTFVAFAGLLKFYHAVDKELQWCRPFPKFLCIKGVVFMTFWQGLALQILAQTTGAGEDNDTWSEQIQNFLICLEMLLFSIAHFYCFPVFEWQPGYKVNYRKAKFGESMALNDFFDDLKIIMTQGNKKKKKKRSKKPSETTIPEEDDDETETVDDSVSAMGSMDEEDTQDAFVRVLSRGMNSYEDEDENEELLSASGANSMEAQKTIGTMLGEMLFDPEDPTEKSSEKFTEKSSEMSGEKSQEDPTENSPNIEPKGGRDLDEEDEILFIHREGLGETTGLLTGEAAPSLTNNLRPSIFTTISQQQSLEDLKNADEENALDSSNGKNEGNKDDESNEGDLDARDGRAFGKKDGVANV